MGYFHKLSIPISSRCLASELMLYAYPAEAPVPASTSLVGGRIS